MRCLSTEKEEWFGVFFFFLKAGGMSLVLMTFSDLIVGLVQLLQELGKGPAMTCHNMHIR